MKSVIPRIDKSLLVLIAAFLAQWSLLFSIQGPTWDAVSYYVYARSAVFDGDLKLENDYVLSYATATPDFSAKEFHKELTTTGRVAKPFAIGTSLLWLPWLYTLRGIVADGPALLARGYVDVSGYEWPFIANVATLSALSAFLAFWLSFKIVRTELDGLGAVAATLTMMFATPLLYYQFREPLYSHTSSALTTTLCVYAWWRMGKPVGTAIQAVGLGALIGLATLTRWQNVLYLALPFVSAVYWWARLPGECKQQKWKPAIRYLGLVSSTVVVVFSLQMAVWRLFYGSWLTIPQGDSFLEWRAPFLLPLLFSTFRGLLPWMPVIFPAFVGLIALSRQGQRRLALPLMAVLLLEIYINASTRDWFGGGGFGPRRFTSELTLLIVGYAGFLQLFSPQKIKIVASSIIGLLLALHHWLLLRYALPEKIGGQVVSMLPTFEWRDVTLVTFIGELAAHVPGIIRRPLEFLLLPGSPLDLLLRQQSWPGHHIMALLTTTLFIVIVLTILGVVGRRLEDSAGLQHLLVTVAFALIGAATLWILIWA